MNYLISQLGKRVFFPEYSAVKDNCLIGIYRSNSWQSSKDRVMDQSCCVKRMQPQHSSRVSTYQMFVLLSTGGQPGRF